MLIGISLVNVYKLPGVPGSGGMMAQIKVYAGDFLTGCSTYIAGGFRLKTLQHWVRGEFIALMAAMQ